MANAYGLTNQMSSLQLQGTAGASVGMSQRPMPTLSSALSKVDGINTRLDEAIKQMQAIHDQIGGPRPVGDSAGSISPKSAGAVGCLNSAAERAHERIGELEGLISLVARALG